MFVYENFEKLKKLAEEDPVLRKQLLAVRQEQNPLSTFCSIARQNRCELYPMEIIEAGEVSYTSMKRSTNGGGENSPMLGSWNDYFGMFLEELEAMEE